MTLGNDEQRQQIEEEGEPVQCFDSGISNIQLNLDCFQQVAVILGTAVSHEWMNIGVLVGVPIEKLKTINFDFGLSVDACLHKMLSCYFNCDLSNTWGVLISAVKLFSIKAAKELVVLCQELNPALEQFDHKLLLKEVTHSSCSRADMQNVFWHLIPYASKCCQIGENLKIPPELLQAILQDHSRCYDRLREIIHVAYTQMDDKCTWFSFANALENIHVEAAANLRAKGIVGK